MINNILDGNATVITANQTQKLFDLYKKEKTFAKEKGKVLSRVALMTPENIHINAFMYEPLIDMSLRHLIDLYGDVKAL